MEGISLLPNTLPEVENLILALYSSTPPESITEIQSTLHKIQKSPQGWHVAQQLMDRTDERVRFFGVLTLIVKLNTESSELNDEAAAELLHELLSWLNRCTIDRTGPLVTRKLSSALVTFLIQLPKAWERCLCHVASCLALGITEKISPEVNISSLLPQLDIPKIQTIVALAADIAEEVSKIDFGADRSRLLYQRVRDISDDVVSLLHHCFTAPVADVIELNSLRLAAMKCFQSWVLFSQKSFSRTDSPVSSLQPLVLDIFEALQATEETFTAALDVFTDLLVKEPDFFPKEHIATLYGLIQGPLAFQFVNRIASGDFDTDCTQFATFALALADSRLEKIATDASYEDRQLLEIFTTLITAEGYPVADNSLFVPALEFWSNYAETVADQVVISEVQSNNEPIHPLQAAITQLSAISLHVCKKMGFPPSAVLADWDSSERDGFVDARRDASDFLQSAYSVIGPPLLQAFADITLSYIASNSWLELEAPAFCLASLADCTSSNEACYGILNDIFGPSFFQAFLQSHPAIPHRTRQTVISLIEKMSDYFEQATDRLPGVLNILYNSVNDPLLAVQASRSIHRLCTSCRTHLAPEIETFFQQYSSILAHTTLDCLTMERIISANAATAEAISDTQVRFMTVERLLDFIANDVQLSLQLATQTIQMHGGTVSPTRCAGRCLSGAKSEDYASHVAIRAIRCLVGMGKGLQSQIDIEEDDRLSQTPGNISHARLSTIHNRVFDILVRLQRLFPHNSEIVELVCTTFRTGFSETVPGPFVLPPNMILEYLLANSLQTPRIGVVVSLACSYISSFRKSSLDQVNEVTSRVITWDIGLLRGLPDSDYDPELVQNGVELVQRVLLYDFSPFLIAQPTENLEFFFLFTLRILNGREPLPKSAAADFWTSFIAAKITDPTIRDLRNEALEKLGPQLSLTLVQNIGGNASRSELDKLCDPIKKLVTGHVHSKRWLDEALMDPTFPSALVSIVDRQTFLKKLFLLRGSRSTNQLVREFWLSCRGSKFAYAS